MTTLENIPRALRPVVGLLLAFACADEPDLAPCDLQSTAGVPDHYGEAEDGRRLVIFAEPGNEAGMGFALYFGDPNRMIRRTIISTAVAGDGGSKLFVFSVDGRVGEALFRISGTASLDIGGTTQGLRAAAKGARPEGLTFYCPSP